MGQMDLHYLTGFEADGFGPATIHTLARADYPAQCPNAARFFKNLRFTLDMEGAVMEQILAGKDAEAAAAEWLKANPDAAMPWIEGVTTFDGQPATFRVTVQDNTGNNGVFSFACTSGCSFKSSGCEAPCHNAKRGRHGDLTRDVIANAPRFSA